MITRNKVLSNAVDECIKDLYSFVQPSVTWEDFLEENRIYNKRKEGPKPFKFYYLPGEIIKDIVDSYIYAYKLDSQQELLDTIETLKNYCKEPIVDKYVDDWTDETGFHHPGYRSYDHPDNLEKKLDEMIRPYTTNVFGIDFQNKFFEFLDMAGQFYNWNGDLNSFNMSIYLGASPCPNKETVIENWKKYRNQDIIIDEEQIKKEYYGEDELD